MLNEAVKPLQNYLLTS